VGYGDISANTQLEIIFSIIIMLSGVGFYSFMIGSLSAFLSDMDTRSAEVTAKLATIETFSQEAQINTKDKRKMR
jgi:hyperpolarization activated cyclic nucleotide-gated potassium channel 1